MPLTRQEIIDFASRYVAPEQIGDFPFDGDIFCLLDRKLIEGKVLKEEEGWQFRGYGVCSGYSLDSEVKPAGKWLWMHFVSLAVFPPAPQTMRLQPPHVVRGRFQDPSRTREYRIIKVDLKKENPAAVKGVSPKDITQEELLKARIVPFRKRKS
ncbi:MAG: hypothetical protein JW699_01530 [Chitinispirillaceae bacterium]|nr:hypothetical protein [Chitinispirillaceae bacterium]